MLGHKAGDAAKWLHCDLARVLISEADVRAAPAPGVDAATGEVRPPQFANYGVGTREAGLLLETLPEMTVKAGVEFGTLYREMDPKQLLKLGKEAEKEEVAKSAVFARLVDLRNANARGITYENTRRIVATFSEPENPTDTGRPEVQGVCFSRRVFRRVADPCTAALATMRIRNLWDHLGRCKKDIANRRSLRRLVHKRAKILRYLKTVDEDRYDRVLERLGLERGAVEGELVV